MEAIQAVCIHTYKPTDGFIPKRGLSVVKVGTKLAVELNIPIILTVGFTTNSQDSEAVKYAEAIKIYCEDHDLRTPKIILGKNPKALCTYSETGEMVRLLNENNFSKFLVVCGEYHVPRVKKYWSLHKLFPTIHKAPTSLRYLAWEKLMQAVEMVLQPGTTARQQVLTFFRHANQNAERS